MKCQICKHFTRPNELGIHVFNHHQIRGFDYAIKYLAHSIDPPFCKCGCGYKVVKWNGIGHGWAKYLRGHNPFNLSKRDPIKFSKAISEGMKRLYASGWIAPRKGKTKENDLAMKLLSEKFKGRKCPEKIRQKISETLKRKYQSKGFINPMKGKTKETYLPLAKISEKLIGRSCSDEIKNKISQTVRNLHKEGKVYGKSFREKLSIKAKEKGKKGLLWAQTIQGKQLMSKLCTEKNLQGKMQIPNSKLPTKPERIIIDWFPNLSYVGNGQKWVTFGGKHHNPDFISKDENKVIEVFGDFWHKKEEEQHFINGYKSIGFECLVIWESDIITNPRWVQLRVQEFLTRKESGDVILQGM